MDPGLCLLHGNVEHISNTARSGEESGLISQKSRLQGSYSFELFKFHDFPWIFLWPSLVFHDLKLSCRFRKVSKLSLFLKGLFGIPTSKNGESGINHNAWRSHCLITCLCHNFSCVDNFHDLSTKHRFNLPWLSRTGKWNSWLSRFSMNCTNPGLFPGQRLILMAAKQNNWGLW